MMADIAAVFHWPLSELAAMDVLDLIDWRTRAVDRFHSMHDVKGGR